MKPKITEAWESLGAVAGTRYDLSRWSADRATLWVTLWSDRLKRVESGIYRYTLCEDGDLKRTTANVTTPMFVRHQARRAYARVSGVAQGRADRQGHRGIEDVDATRQYAVEVESQDGNVIVALAKGL